MAIVNESRIRMEREYQKSVALQAAGECIEALRILGVIADPSKNNDKLDRAHDAANKLALVIKEEL